MKRVGLYPSRMIGAQPGDWIHHPTPNYSITGSGGFVKMPCSELLYVSDEIWLEWNGYGDETFRCVRPVAPYHEPDRCPLKKT